MIRKLGVAAACGVALYGLMKFVNSRASGISGGSDDDVAGKATGSAYGSDAAGEPGPTPTPLVATEQVSGDPAIDEVRIIEVTQGDQHRDQSREATCM